MSLLDTLIADHLPGLSGAEFKLAVYLYRSLRRRPEVNTMIATLSEATGLSWRQTQSAVRSLAKKGILEVDGRPRIGTRFRLPARLVRSKPPTQGSLRARPSSPAQPSAPANQQSARAEVGETLVTVPATLRVEPPVAPTSASPQEIEHAAKNEQVRTLVCTLMDTRRPIGPQDFNMLLQCADGELERLLARLQRLVQQRRRFDHARELGAQIRSMVTVREDQPAR